MERNLIFFILIFFILLFILIFFILIYIFTFQDKKKLKKKEKWIIISSVFFYFYDGSKKDNFYFKRKIPGFKQSLVHKDIFYSFLNERSSSKFKKEIGILIKTKKIKSNEKLKVFFLEINSKKTKCFFKFFLINKKTKTFKGIISNL